MATFLLIGGVDAQIGQIVIGADPEGDNLPTWTSPNGKYPALLWIGEEEIVEVTGGSGTAILSVNRGARATVATAHDSGTVVEDIAP